MTISALTGAAWLLIILSLLAWIIWQMVPERVFCSQGEIVKKHRGRRESMSLADIDRIDFHYHAVVGFIGVWEFVSKSQQCLSVGSEALGMSDVLRVLERDLPGFSVAEFERQFEAGDVEDSLHVWSIRTGAR